MERLQYSDSAWVSHVLCSVKFPEEMEIRVLQLMGTLLPGEVQIELEGGGRIEEPQC